MLQVYTDLNAKWLLLGTGPMVEITNKSRTLFDQLTDTVSAQSPLPDKTEIKPQIEEPTPAETKEIIAPPPPVEKMTEKNVIQDQFFSPEKPVERLIVFFKDQTFKVYYPSL
jgi:hypothetical protein